MRILVTGGAGYIGSHTIIELIHQGHSVTAVDNLSNGSAEALKRVEKITKASIPLHAFDLQDKISLNALFDKESFDAVIHFAGLKAVNESVQNPLLYYRTNLDATMSLLEVMDAHDVRTLVFSSSATVYGSAPIPYTETSTVGQGITNPYGQTKYMIEQILQDTASQHPDSNFTVLRYFNPVGAHESGLIGEDPQGTPNNLMPIIAQVAAHQREKLVIFGDDYPTPDGTCIRDFIHVTDVAKGHVAALEHTHKGIRTYNLGSGKGSSVLELLQAFVAVSGQNIPYVFEGRRSGDLPEYYADPSKAKAELNWKTEKTIDDICKDTWNWQSKNPHGYKI